MKSMMKKLAVTLMGLTVAGAIGHAAEASLKAGDPAPKLRTGKWVQGDQVTEFKKGKVYLVEFWATWCGPCKVSIPHLNEIHNKFKEKGLVVIGQDCWEKDDTLVAPFVEKMGEKMTYCVALDDKSAEDGKKNNGRMAETWMAAAGQNGIPTAFLVDKEGKIAWIGHPMTLKESVIEEVLSGTFDIKKAAADAENAKKGEGQIMKASQALGQAMQNKDWDEAMTKVDELDKLLPDEQKSGLDMARFAIYIGKKDLPAVYKVAEKVSLANKDNAMVQNELAWKLITDPAIEKPDLKVAETIAKRAVTASESKDGAILDTMARVLFMQGKKEEAITLQEKAVKIADSSMQDQLQATLDSYKKGELPKAE
jgi:thiol-disulfide isomerase/thioredoxin